MKKFFAVLAMSAFLFACGDSATNEEVTPEETTPVETPAETPADTQVDTTTAPLQDTPPAEAPQE